MATYNVTLSLDDEYEAALSELVSEWNAQNGTNYTNGDFIHAYAMGELKARVDIRYERALKELGEAAKALSYADRQALMAQVAASIRTE